MREASGIRFSAFIKANLGSILAQWDAFAATLLPAAEGMSRDDLRDHSREILLAIARDMETNQTEAERFSKSKRMIEPPGIAESAASLHGAARQTSGFELTQLVGEFRAMRASVLGFWSRSNQPEGGRPAAEEIARFNESLDQTLAASVERCADEISTSRDMLLAVLGHDVGRRRSSAARCRGSGWPPTCLRFPIWTSRHVCRWRHASVGRRRSSIA